MNQVHYLVHLVNFKPKPESGIYNASGPSPDLTSNLNQNLVFTMNQVHYLVHLVNFKPKPESGIYNASGPSPDLTSNLNQNPVHSLPSQFHI